LRQIFRAGPWLFVSLGLALVLVVFSRLAGQGAPHALDIHVNAAFQRIWWQPSFPLFEGIAVIGGIELTSILAAALFLLLLWRRRRAEAVALLAFPGALLVERLSRYVVVHPGPAVTHAGQLSVTRFITDQGNNSYPSGHVVRAIIIFGLVAVLAHRLPAPAWARRLAAPLAILLVAAIAFDRLYLAVHWASDVIGGVLLGALSLSVAMLWLDVGGRLLSHVGRRPTGPG
jgi:membrane-associated phospholipid phosphatase